MKKHLIHLVYLENDYVILFFFQIHNILLQSLIKKLGYQYCGIIYTNYDAKRLAFEKEIDWLEFRISLPEETPEKAGRIAELIKKRYSLQTVNFTTKKELEPYKEKIFKVFNKF